MAWKIGKLNPTKVAKAIEPGVYGDGGGLALRVSRGAGRSWIFRYQKDGKAHEIGLGPARLIPLSEARQKAREQARLILDGVDPIARRNEAKSGRTFGAVAEDYIKAHSAGWRSEKHKGQWRTTLATHPTGGYSTEAGIMDILTRMRDGRFKIVTDGLTEWREEFLAYHRKNGLIVKSNDDLLSATRVGVMQIRSARPAALDPVRPGEAPGHRRWRGPEIAPGTDFDVFA